MSVVDKYEGWLNEAIAFVASNREAYVVNPKSDFTRKRILNFEGMVKIMIAMEGGSLNKELHDYRATNYMNFTKSAFVQQRSKIRPNAMEDIFTLFNKKCCDKKTFRGYRLYAVDGSDINVPTNPFLESYVISNQHGAGHNLLKLNVLYDLMNKTYVDTVIQPIQRENERGALQEMLKSNCFEDSSIVIVDRGYDGYNVFAHFLNTPNVDFVCRGRLNNPMRVIAKAYNGEFGNVSFDIDGEFDIDVEPEIATTQTNDDKRHGRIFIQTGSKKGKKNSPKTIISSWDFGSPYKMKFRAVKFRLDNGSYELIYTSLPRDKFTAADIKELYHKRWGVETSFRELKYTIGLSHLHTRKEELVKQEIYAALIMYNLCERIASEVVIPNKKGRIYEYRVNFSMLCHICKNAYRDGTLTDKVLEWIQKYISPVRQGRAFKRNMKIKGFVSFIYRVPA